MSDIVLTMRHSLLPISFALLCAISFVLFIAAVNAQVALNWQLSSDAHWAHSCDFDGNDIGSVRVAAEKCSAECGKAVGCTHFAWTLYDGGTCWLKNNPTVRMSDATFVLTPSSVCGIMRNLPPTEQDSSGQDPTTEYRLFTRDSGKIVITKEFSEEDGGKSDRANGPIAGIQCSGRYCDNKRLVTVVHGGGPMLGHGFVYWTPPISEEDPEGTNCPYGTLVNQIQCTGRYCDNISLRCAVLDPRYRVDTSDLRTVSWFSEEEGEGLCDDGYYLWGLRCRGRFCDGLELKCARVDYDPATVWGVENFRDVSITDSDLQPTKPTPDKDSAGGNSPQFGPGHTSPASFMRRAGRNWMRLVEDDRRLNRMSIPGTHDSAARDAEFYCRNQVWSIFDQLDSGIRYLDIRARREGDQFSMYHGLCDLKLRFDDVMNDVQTFLGFYPSETILMRVKEEHTPKEGSLEFGKIWERYMEKYGQLFVGDLKGVIPQLGNVRGKIVLLWDQDEIQGRGLPYSGDATYVQDKFEFRSFADKQDKIAEYLKKEKDKLVLNHISGIKLPYPNVVLPDPYYAALRLNPFTYREIGEYRGRRDLGVVIMDFPGEKLIYRILRHNF